LSGWSEWAYHYRENNMETVIITIDGDGNPTVETKGFTGPACQTATKALEKALGKVESEKLTDEYQKREVGRVRH
jgi:hypothetical protein